MARFEPGAVLYARFSPRPNAQDCDSCERQLMDMRRYCRRHGWPVRSEHMDKDVSGATDWDKRPGLLRAVASTRRGDILVVRDWDRLYRDYRKAVTLITHLESKGARIVTLNDSPLEPESVEDRLTGELIRMVFLWVAEYQRALTSARTSRRMRDHQKNGRRMSLSPPYGMKRDPHDPSRMIPCPEEQVIVDEIKQMRIREGLSLGQIADRLSLQGRKRRDGGRVWHRAQIQKILEREGIAPVKPRSDPNPHEKDDVPPRRRRGPKAL